MKNQELPQLESKEQKEIVPRPDQTEPLITRKEEEGLRAVGGTQIDRPIMPINEEETAHRLPQPRNIKTPASDHPEALTIKRDESGKFITHLEDVIGDST